MPAIAAHYLFGRRMLERLGDDEFTTGDDACAFLLGNQGPDPLYGLVITPVQRPWSKLSGRMHSALGSESIDVLLRACTRMEGHDRSVAEAYVKGYICHFTLDSLVHPFVYAWEQALVNAGVEGLGPEMHHHVHAWVEADIDASLMRRYRPLFDKELRADIDALRAGFDVLHVIDELYAAAAPAFNMRVPRNVFTQGMVCYRLSMRTMRSDPGAAARLVLRGVEKVLRQPESIVKAMSVRKGVGAISGWENDEHWPWANPFTNQESTDSLDDLFHRAYAEACEAIDAMNAGGRVLQALEPINFRGEPASLLAQ